MKKALITGMSGFVGKYLQRQLTAKGYEVAGTCLPSEPFANEKNYFVINLLEKDTVDKVISEYMPDEIYHLAGQSSVALSWKNPTLTVQINVNGTVNLLDAVHTLKPECKVLVIGSSDEYGPVKQEDCPITEEHPLAPVSPYGISKMTAEKMSQLYAKAYNMNIIMVRPFNHIGPGQNKGFVVADFASSIAEIEAGKNAPVLKVGNLHSFRDFTDVEDVVAAYAALMESGKAGEVYNVGSGKAIEIDDILQRLLKLSKVDIKVEIDQDRYRPVDVPLVVCDNTKLSSCTGWKPKKDFEKTLEETLDYWRGKTLS